MLEIVFDQNTAGSMAVAMNHPPRASEAVGVVMTEEGGRKPSRLEIRLATRRVRRENARNWAQAVPLAGNREDILCFPLALNVGQLDETGMGARRAETLNALAAHWPGDTEKGTRELLDTAQKNLDTLLARAKTEPVRFWVSEAPAEACGLCFLLDRLRPLGLEKLSLSLAVLPRFWEENAGTLVEYRGWGDVPPHALGKLAGDSKPLSATLARALANRWADLRRENAPLRAVLNGKLVSVPETWYDSFLLKELEGMDAEFNEANLIGNILGKYRLGVGDGWLHRRVEALLQTGRLAALTQPGPDQPAYRRVLRRQT